MNRYPWSATFELTARCNLRCKMCLVRVDEARIRELNTRELTAGEWINLAQQARDIGTLNLLLTGGEPTLRPDFCEIYEAVTKMGFFLTLYTNATLLTPKVQDALRRYPPHRIGVTVYGASADTYERTCGSAAGFERMLEGVAFLRTLPSQLEVRTTLIKDNVADFDAIRDLAMSWDADMPFSTSVVINQGVRGAVSDVASCRLSPEENQRLLERAAIRAVNDLLDGGKMERLLRMREDMTGAEKAAAARRAQTADDTIFGCGAGVYSYTLAWNGHLLGCQMMDCVGESVIMHGLAAAWERYPDTIDLGPLVPACAACADLQRCASCHAVRMAESGSYCGLPEYHCRITKLTSPHRDAEMEKENERVP